MTLPNFMIIGVAKAGTTSFFRYLDQHPQVYMCPLKGSNYFGHADAVDWKWHQEAEPPLLRHFQVQTFQDYEALFADAGEQHKAIGEVSPQYFRCPGTAGRIREHIPEAKLVVSLRNPADRAYSGFMMRTRRGEPVDSAYAELTPDASHVKEGFYFRRMKRYFDVFPRRQLKVYIFEEFKAEPLAVLRDLFGFLNVDPSFTPNTSVRHNPAAVPRSRLLNRLLYHPTLMRTSRALLPDGMVEVAKRVRQQNLKASPKFPPDLRADLLDLYREDIYRLEELLDRDLSIWLSRT